MSQAGWYPDPGGQPGMYRYWTGSSWSASITNNPMQAPPSGGLGGLGGPQHPGQPQWSPSQQQQQPRRSPVGWWLGIAAIVLVIAVLGWFAIRNLGGILGTGPSAGSNPTQNVCPKQVASTITPAPAPNDGRVHGGALSYPRLDPPWGPPVPETRVPFGRDVLTQTVMVEPSYKGTKDSWVASVLVGELVAGDGFFSPQQGSEIVVKCIMGVFYDDAEVVRDDKVNKATTVDGKEAWLVETHLSFDIPNLKTKGELAIIMIVATSAASSSIFYASIPDTVPDLVPDARRAMAGLKVTS
ncbi:MAG: DUF2510 domain-containing protein [Micropruina sp.]|uniref:DUF2510 domain-containing protein n=1 Tax=Micropruina sp. TaxID=2737536 RepID=UPI0039E3896E